MKKMGGGEEEVAVASSVPSPSPPLIVQVQCSSHKGHLNFKLDFLQDGQDGFSYISFSSFTISSSPSRIFTLYLFRLPCHFYLVAIDQTTTMCRIVFGLVSSVRPVFVQPAFIQLFSSNPFHPILLG